ncbi:hypothetical protein [Mucisphaera calidilacus]|uniref:Uncharacterized protein n=1 Tax=Mucisphaera calidilacus TaxID=2527982 RepID=A0A518C041_9BACT|nr:hypothetical protein [Mucisphaera calidilacus]QDU72585.1 hypothetical protein Pan265_24550 [Mucisphaera calidilacus]
MGEAVVSEQAAEALEQGAGLGDAVHLFGEPCRGGGEEGDLLEVGLVRGMR